jgi:hypothetical protein
MAWSIQQVPYAKVLKGSDPSLKDVYRSVCSLSSWSCSDRPNRPDLQVTLGAETRGLAMNNHGSYRFQQEMVEEGPNPSILALARRWLLRQGSSGHSRSWKFIPNQRLERT